MALLDISSGLEKDSQHSGMTDLLRFTTAGSVDDGKSTLIGRLLYDSHGIYDDQLASLKKAGVNRAAGAIDLSLLTDGLRAEREQGITIDVAYRHFSTPRRRFIIADTPGHEQYTRNMATGASTADLAIILVDATKGLLAQSRRHTYIAALLGIQNIIVAVNKMDLLSYSQERFEQIARDFRDLATQLGIENVYALPISALNGDNIVRPSSRVSWFDGVPLLEYLETVPLTQTNSFEYLRLPIQLVIRSDSAFRGVAGQLASGVLRRGDRVVALPSRVTTRVKNILSFDGELNQVTPQSSVTVTFEDEIDLSRGDLLTGEDDLPHISTNISAKLVWLHPDAYEPGKLYLLKHTTKLVRARVSKLLHCVDVNTLDHLPASTLRMNDIAAVHIQTTLPLFFDAYRQNRTMGSFVLIDPITHATVAAGMIEGTVEEDRFRNSRHQGRVRLHERIARSGHAPAVLWIVGRESIAEKLERIIFERGWQVVLLSSTETAPDHFQSLATMLQRTGVIAIISLPEDNPALRTMVETVYGTDSVFHSRHLPSADSDAIAHLLKWISHPQRNVLAN